MIKLSYCSHVQNIGWQGYVSEGEVSGTQGQSLRLEAFRAKLETDLNLKLEYCAHIENIGWTDYVENDKVVGTEGQSLRIEAIKMRLSGSDSDKYDIWYRCHVQDIGSMDFAKNDEPSGSEGYSYRVEGIEVVIVEKGDKFDSDNVEVSEKKMQEFIDKIADNPPTFDTSQMASAHFAWVEYACDCIKSDYMFGWCNGYPETAYPDHSMSPEIINKIEILKQYIVDNYGDYPIYVNSGVRCEQCNEHWGGVPDSLHKLGEAADLYCPNFTPQEFADLAYNVVGLGVIIYSNFVHTQIWPRYSYA